MSPLRLAYALDLAAGGEPLACEVAPTDLQEAAGALFPAYRTPSPSVEADVVLRRDESGDYHVRSPRGEEATGDPSEALARWELAVALALLDRAPGHLRLHAGGVEAPGGALLLPGAAATGKSTLTLALGARGLPVLGDDILLLDPEDGRVHPFKRLLKADRRSFEIAGASLPEAGPLHGVWPGVGLVDPEALGSRWAGATPVSRVVFTRRDPDAELPRLEPLKPADALRRLLECLVQDPAPGAREFGILADAVADAELSELRFARSDEAADFLIAGSEG